MEIEDVQALPKGKDYIEVDFLKKKVLYIPDSVDVDIDIENGGTIRAKYKKEEKNHFYDLFFQATDANGEAVERNGSSQSQSEEYVESTYSYDIGGKTNPIRIYFNSYENYLIGSASLDIPLK